MSTINVGEKNRDEPHWHKNELWAYTVFQGSLSLSLCVYVCLFPGAHRCTVAGAQKTEWLIFQCPVIMLRKVSHASEAARERLTGWPQITHRSFLLPYQSVNSISVYMHAISIQIEEHSHHMPHLGLYFGHSYRQISSPLPFHSSGPYVSLLLQHPRAPRGQQAAGLSGCWVLRDRRDDNVYVPSGIGRDSRKDRKA